MRHLPFLISVFLHVYVEINVAHPFGDGNGRSTRIWLDRFLKTEIGNVMDWCKVNKEDYDN